MTQSATISTINPLPGTSTRPQSGWFRRRQTHPAGDSTAGNV